jgi:hypothetical protein
MVLGLSGCDGEPLVVPAPGQSNGNESTIFCSNAEPCPSGMRCDQGICMNEGPGFNPPDTTTADGGSICDNIPNAPGCIDISDRNDIATTTDTMQQSDVFAGTDIVWVDSGGSDVEPAPDQCTPPGNPTACSDTEELYDGCRIDESTKGAVCISSTNFGLLGAPCLSHESCDILLGCHFGMCAPYCNLGFGTLVNGGGLCPSTMPTCKSVGHLQFGACAAQ